jgi:hypothetical protein
MRKQGKKNTAACLADKRSAVRMARYYNRDRTARITRTTAPEVPMNKFAALALLVLLSACSSNSGGNTQKSNAATSSPQSSNAANAGTQTAVLHPTNMTFKAADAACAGSLGSVTFNMGHARPHAAAGVTLHEQPESSSGIATMTFSDKANGKTAAVTVNGHNRSVSGKHVTVKRNRSVACVNAG